MPRLTSKTTGVVVNVDDATAALLVGFESAEKKPAPKRHAAKSDDK